MARSNKRPRATTASIRLVARMFSSGSASEQDEVGELRRLDRSEVMLHTERSGRLRGGRAEGLGRAQAGLDQQFELAVQGEAGGTVGGDVRLGEERDSGAVHVSDDGEELRDRDRSKVLRQTREM